MCFIEPTYLFEVYSLFSEETPLMIFYAKMLVCFIMRNSVHRGFSRFFVVFSFALFVIEKRPDEKSSQNAFTLHNFIFCLFDASDT